MKNNKIKKELCNIVKVNITKMFLILFFFKEIVYLSANISLWRHRIKVYIVIIFMMCMIGWTFPSKT